jgi:hypothetical protein
MRTLLCTNQGFILLKRHEDCQFGFHRTVAALITSGEQTSGGKEKLRKRGKGRRQEEEVRDSRRYLSAKK